jgi:hypothetical protein
VGLSDGEKPFKIFLIAKLLSKDGKNVPFWFMNWKNMFYSSKESRLLQIFARLRKVIRAKQILKLLYAFYRKHEGTRSQDR